MGYREKYMKGKGRIHICKYCGAIKTRKSITVDHVLPQKLFRVMTRFLTLAIFIIVMVILLNEKMFPFDIYDNVVVRSIVELPNELVNKLLKFGIQLVIFAIFINWFKHSKLNMVASCKKCNSSKSAKIDHRVVQGYIAMVLFSKPIMTLALVATLSYMVNRFYERI